MRSASATLQHSTAVQAVTGSCYAEGIDWACAHLQRWCHDWLHVKSFLLLAGPWGEVCSAYLSVLQAVQVRHHCHGSVIPKHWRDSRTGRVSSALLILADTSCWLSCHAMLAQSQSTPPCSQPFLRSCVHSACNDLCPQLPLRHVTMVSDAMQSHVQSTCMPHTQAVGYTLAPTGLDTQQM